MTNENEYMQSLKQICEFLTENKNNADYVVNCFYRQIVRNFVFYLFFKGFHLKKLDFTP